MLLQQKISVQIAFMLSFCNCQSSHYRTQQCLHYSHSCDLILMADHTTARHIVKCSHPNDHTLLYFFYCLTWQQKCQRKIFGKVIFSLTDFIFFLVSSTGGNSVCADSKSHSTRCFREKFWLLDYTSPNIYTFPICLNTELNTQYLKLWGLSGKC